MTNILKCTFFILLTFINYNICAVEDKNDYNSDYYENAGRLLFKVRAYGVKSDNKQSLPSLASATNPTKSSPLFNNGYGAETAAVIFFHDHVAAELSLGFNGLYIKSTALTKIADNYNVSTTLNKRRFIYTIPLILTAQYHIAPFGAIRPYIGTGVHGTYIINKNKSFKVDSGYGFVLQLGVDFVVRDDTMFNIDVRQSFLKTKINYKGSIVGNVASGVSSTVKINPLMISIGFGIRL
jgi:outer membrane protein